VGRPRLLYLGPPGSFTHAGAASVPEADAAPARDAREIVAAVEAGTADLGLVPLENSVEGDVPGTLDELVFGSASVFLRREVVVPVTFVLAGLPGAAEGRLTRVLSHPHAIGQCRRVVAELGLEVELTPSTSQACADVAARQDPSLAALASTAAVELHGLAALRSGVEDVPGAATRMALIGRELAAPSGRDITVAVLTPDTNRTGILAEALRCFSDRGVALSRISSRPLKAQLGTYVFVVAAAGHLADQVVADAFEAVTRLGVLVKVLGSCPETAPVQLLGTGAAQPPGSVDADGWAAWRDTALRGAV
jgi:prephenate dehydratase